MVEWQLVWDLTTVKYLSTVKTNSTFNPLSVFPIFHGC